MSSKYFIAGFITALIFIIGIYFFAEFEAKKLLISLGVISNNGIINSNPYGRVLNLYTVSDNTPNFIYQAYDENFHKSTVTTDSNGFIIGSDNIMSLSREKSSSTIRIFLIGGSAAFGSLQTRGYVPDTSYPSGTYTYNASICGKLKKILTIRYPEIKFEVVNAGVVLHQFHQGYAMYLEKIHDFHPDIIINLDFQNDMPLLSDFSKRGDPYLQIDQMNEQLNLEMLKRCSQSPYISLWWNVMHLKELNKLETVDGLKHNNNPISNDTTRLHFGNYYENYKLIKPYLIQNMQKILWLINTYETQLQVDSVYSVFCIQPMLMRRDMQKKLSPLELKLKSVIEKANSPHDETVADSVLFQPYLNYYYSTISPDIANAMRKMGNNKFKIPEYTAIVFNNYLSPTIDSLVLAHNGTFIDFGKQMIGMSAEHEFYVDHCHMTPYGNQFVAQQMADAIDGYLQKKKSTIKEKLP